MSYYALERISDNKVMIGAGVITADNIASANAKFLKRFRWNPNMFRARRVNADYGKRHLV